MSLRDLYRMYAAPNPSVNEQGIIFFIGVATGALFVFILLFGMELRRFLVI